MWAGLVTCFNPQKVVTSEHGPQRAGEAGSERAVGGPSQPLHGSPAEAQDVHAASLGHPA